MRFSPGLILLQQRGHLFPWVPVCLGLGIAGYFSLRFEPIQIHYVYAGCTAALFAVLALRLRSGTYALCWAIALVAVGFCIAGARAHMVANPVLTWRYYGPIEGRIVQMDRSSSDALRLTLDQVDLYRVQVADRPKRVRVSLHGDAADWGPFLPGDRVMMTGHLMPPQGPAEPHGFDFRRHAWFLQLGAVGYTRNPVLKSVQPEQPSQKLNRFRARTSAAIRQELPGEVGGFAAAITTGDRSGVGADTLQALRDSNLAHLLAISGLHMGLLAGFVFAAIRFGLNLVPRIALRVPVKQIAAGGALGVSALYLALSGGNVATERAFIMAAVALVAVILNRRAFSLRAVALAAILVLIRRPESLYGPGFQMSFAATTALIAVFGWLSGVGWLNHRKWLRGAVGVVVSSAVAGAATAPIGAAHFNTLSQFGLIANLLSVPLMGIMIIPAAVLAAVLWPVGLSTLALTVMGWGLNWILSVAHYVADLEGSVRYVKSPDGFVLPVLCLGAFVLVLWQRRLRWLGILPALAAIWLWIDTDRPHVLIDAEARLVGVMTENGRALSRPKGSGFVAGIWLENDGSGLDQKEAASLWGKVENNPIGDAEIPLFVRHIYDKSEAAMVQACPANEVIVSRHNLVVDGPCTLFDPSRLERTGSVAITGSKILTAADVTGARLWTHTRAARDQ